MNPVELLMRRRVIRAFILADPIALVIRRAANATKNTKTGGYVASTKTPLPSQTARLVLNKRRYNRGLVNSEAGDIPHTDYLLIAEHSVDIEEEDEFTWKGEHYKVMGIHKQRVESILASVDMLGPDNRD